MSELSPHFLAGTFILSIRYSSSTHKSAIKSAVEVGLFAPRPCSAYLMLRWLDHSVTLLVHVYSSRRTAIRDGSLAFSLQINLLGVQVEWWCKESLLSIRIY